MGIAQPILIARCILSSSALQFANKCLYFHIIHHMSIFGKYESIYCISFTNIGVQFEHLRELIRMFKIILIAIVALFIYGIIKGIKEQRQYDAIPIPDFPSTCKDGTKLMRTMEFTLSGVNHVHDGSDPQKVITPSMKGQWLTLQPDLHNKYDGTAVKVLYNGQYIGFLPASNISLSERDVKNMIFKRLSHGLEVLARFEHTTSIQVGGWDLDDDDPRLSDYEFTSAVITCAIYELPGGRYPK